MNYIQKTIKNLEKYKWGVQHFKLQNSREQFLKFYLLTLQKGVGFSGFHPAHF